jgi:hypothetical protein
VIGSFVVLVTVKVLEAVSTPLAVVTFTGPELVPGMTSASNEVVDLFRRIAVVPPTLTDWAAEKSDPIMVIVVPGGPEEGVMFIPGDGDSLTPELEPPPLQAENKVVLLISAMRAVATQVCRTISFWPPVQGSGLAA